MQKFTTLTGIVAPLPIQNVDTDMIIPKQFLKTIKRTGLKEGLFFEMRFDVNGKKIEDFILHQPTYQNAQVIVSGDNFGCGSSREHAPWALLDQGIRCVIAPSFADIFYNNCFKNGILPITLSEEQVQEITDFASTAAHDLTVDLPSQTITFGNKKYKFEVDAFRKHCLINGLDDIGLTLEKGTKINSFESSQKQSQPWLYSA
jgi:3-isopropylmalate/(R)-2-methylmalate dehydratase small subunit